MFGPWFFVDPALYDSKGRGKGKSKDKGTNDNEFLVNLVALLEKPSMQLAFARKDETSARAACPG
jgi:hypothetical protein